MGPGCAFSSSRTLGKCLEIKSTSYKEEIGPVCVQYSLRVVISMYYSFRHCQLGIPLWGGGEGSQGVWGRQGRLEGEKCQ